MQLLLNTILLYTIALCTVYIIIRKILSRLRLHAAFASIPGPESQGWKKMGNLSQLYSPHSQDFLYYLENFESMVVKLHGYFWDMQLYVFDPLGVKQIVNDIDTYPPTQLFLQANHMMFGGGLLASTGRPHTRQRKMLHPAFSNESLNLMAPVFFDTAHRMQELIQEELEASSPESTEVDILHLASRGALEIIGKAGLGYSFDSFTNVSNPYSQALQVLVPTVFGMFWIRQAFVGIFDYIPSAISRACVKVVPWKRVQVVRKLVASLDKMAKEVYSDRLLDLPEEGTYSSQDVRGKDIISILIRENLKASPADRLSEADIRGQVATLLFAATDTTALAIARILHTLTEHPQAQTTLRNELIQARQTHPVSYDAIRSLPYLDSVCKETLRLHPPLIFTTRTTKRDTVLTLSKPLPGSNTATLSIPGDTNVIVGILPFNRNTEIWGEDAHLWKPERWTNLPDTVQDNNRAGIYANTMSFYGGGKSCIGYKFAEMEIKIIISVLISSFAFEQSTERIIWQTRGLQKPTVEGATSPRLPMVVSILS